MHIYACIYIYICVYVYMYIVSIVLYVYIYIYTYIYICTLYKVTCVCIYIYHHIRYKRIPRTLTPDWVVAVPMTMPLISMFGYSRWGYPWQPCFGPSRLTLGPQGFSNNIFVWIELWHLDGSGLQRHFIALDEPTNYLDVETVDALGKAALDDKRSLLC